MFIENTQTVQASRLQQNYEDIMSDLLDGNDLEGMIDEMLTAATPQQRIEMIRGAIEVPNENHLAAKLYKVTSFLSPQNNCWLEPDHHREITLYFSMLQCRNACDDADLLPMFFNELKSHTFQINYIFRVQEVMNPMYYAKDCFVIRPQDQTALIFDLINMTARK